MKNYLTNRDFVFFLSGLFIGIVIILGFMYGWSFRFLDHIRIEQVVIGINESRLIELAIEQANLTTN